MREHDASGGGDSKAIIRDIARHWALVQPKVSAFISLMIPNYHDAQDVLQEVAMAVFSHDFEKSGAPQVFHAWVLQIARHKVVDFRRKRGRQKGMFDDSIIETIAGAYSNLDDQDYPIRDALEHCLARMQDRARKLIEMRYRFDMQAEEISSATGHGVSAVRVTLYRIRESLRQCIEGYLHARRGV